MKLLSLYSPDPGNMMDFRYDVDLDELCRKSLFPLKSVHTEKRYTHVKKGN